MRETETNMKDQVEELDGETIEVEDALVVDDVTTEDETEEQNPVDQEEATDEPEGDDATETEDDAQADVEELVVSFGDEEPEKQDETPVIRTLRQKAREEKARRKELEKKLEDLTASKPVELGPRPTLASVDFDDERFEAELIAYNDRKNQIGEQEAQAKAQREAAEKEWQGRVQEYAEAKTKLKVSDFDEAEATVKDILSPVQQGIILDAAERPELVVLALGRNTAKAEEIAKITNPVRMAAAIARLESNMKVSNVKSKPAPEKRVTGAVPTASGSADTKLDKLREEAAKTGDYTKVTAFKRKLRET